MKKQQSNSRIDKGIPIPKASKGYGAAKYPWAEMEVGDSFLMNSKGNCAWANMKYAPKHWMTRTTPEGLRVWRDK